MPEVPLRAQIGPQAKPELYDVLADGGTYPIGPQETPSIPNLGNYAANIIPNAEPILGADPRNHLDGKHVLTVRMGSDSEFIDAKIIDTRSLPVTSQPGEPVKRQVGTHDGQPFSMGGDFLLVIPSSDPSTPPMVRELTPGTNQHIGRDSEYANRLLPETVSANQCAIGIEPNGSLVVENYQPVNGTTLIAGSRAQATENTPENQPNRHELTEAEAVDMLSYGDVLDPEAAAQARESVRSGNGLRYVHALQGMTAEIGSAKLAETAQSMQQACAEALEKLGVKPSGFTRSLSWVYWDLGKQRYMSQHPEESSKEYRIADPLDKEFDGSAKRAEIIRRHIGWEISRAIGSGEMEASSLFMARSRHQSIKDILDYGERNETGQLRSFALSHLGSTALYEAGFNIPKQIL